MKSVDEHVPQKTISGKQHVPWINQNIKRLIRQRQRRYNAAKKYDSPENWEKYRTHTSGAYWTATAPMTRTGSQQWARSSGNTLSPGKIDTVNISTLRDKTGTEVIDSRGKTEILNEQYDSVFTDEDMNNIPKMGNSTVQDIHKLVVTEPGVIKLLKKLDISKAIGPDLIPSRILREAADQIAPFLTYIYNQTLTSGTVPSNWKLANITAIYKKGDCTQAVNYRPVSLTSVCCKTMEHIIYRHVMSHLERHSILADHQHGFRQHRSCETQLVNTIEQVARSLDRREQVDMLVLDFSKAFDTVPHQRLLRKMEFYGINGEVLNWISDWLT